MSGAIRMIGGPSDGRPTEYLGELIKVAVTIPFLDRFEDGKVKLEPFHYEVYRIVTRFRGAKGYRAYVHSSIGDDEARARIDHMVGGEAW